MQVPIMILPQCPNLFKTTMTSHLMEKSVKSNGIDNDISLLYNYFKNVKKTNKTSKENTVKL